MKEHGTQARLHACAMSAPDERANLAKVDKPGHTLLSPDRRRGQAIAVPQWWMDEARGRAAAYRGRTVQLGIDLARAVNRAEPFSHSAISKFLDAKQVTSKLVDAFVAMFDLPHPVYYPRSMDEARLIQRALGGAHVEPRPPPEIEDAKLAELDRAAKALDRRAGHVDRSAHAGDGRVGWRSCWRSPST